MPNKLTEALLADTADDAARIIQDALGITDGGPAGICFPDEWPVESYKRAAIITRWLGVEISYAMDSKCPT
jgi:hypothetical protein